MIPMKLRRGLIAALLAVAASAARAQADDARPAQVSLRILAINDLHGHLQPPPGGLLLPDPVDTTGKARVAAGGVERIATLIGQLRAGHSHSIFVAAGDLIGASPLLSAMFHDEPTVESLSMMGLSLSAVGNHEFDEGRNELLRMQNGGCHPGDNCQGPHPFTGAGFVYLAASTVETATGKTLFPPYAIREFEGVKVAFIGLTLKSTPSMVSPAGVAGLSFKDEAETVNALVPQLKARGVGVIVVLIHEGGFPTGGINECPGISGPIVGIVGKLDRAVGVVISGHTHQAYVCQIDGRLVTSADKYGTIVTTIDLALDANGGGIISATANNIVVADSLAKDRAQSALIDEYAKIAAPLAARPAGAITATLSRTPNVAGESELGDIIADAQLAATREPDNGGAVIALTNPGGIRTSIDHHDGGTVSYGEVFAAQPFRNQLVTMTLTGAQLKSALEQQWADPARPRILQVSHGFGFAYDDTAAAGARVAAEHITLSGETIAPDTFYRVTVNQYLADGGDGFAAFSGGTERRTGVYDVDALVSYLKSNSPVRPAAGNRILRMR
jgi:5'-nucleotidase